MSSDLSVIFGSELIETSSFYPEDLVMNRLDSSAIVLFEEEEHLKDMDYPGTVVALLGQVLDQFYPEDNNTQNMHTVVTGAVINKEFLEKLLKASQEFDRDESELNEKNWFEKGIQELIDTFNFEERFLFFQVH